MQHKFITFIGGGNMAQAIIFGLLQQGYPAHKLMVCDPNPSRRDIFAARGIMVSDNNIEAAIRAEVVLLAVKPQMMEAVCLPLQAVDFSHKLLISIAAAISLQRLHDLLPSAANIVRVMPNTPALVSAGMSGLFAAPSLAQDLKDFAEALLAAVGKTCWLAQESDMHKITAASGSSPAYFFAFMEAMQLMLMDSGIDENMARLLVQQSALGAAKMAEQNPQISLSLLRENVTSKGGTTAAALAVFNRCGLDDMVKQAMAACIARSQEMEKLF
ncbi:pyrroline-5-carboxylate reductase [Mesocricetibacter intestinalis]|uniref:Pyrroline-5-carboxylate reductase n=1 Tax=Mesocricetibacter intestinalis TaxID=1521930 RepID=A0A4R6V8W7_9PAST|nr:pyrroline-5-carboxylate reductase [Mesocricetibacter intestinalis]TDQ58091.1 pyrroline-5-carboxylate reductase [Mesocricetibacter intestinalis]